MAAAEATAPAGRRRLPDLVAAAALLALLVYLDFGALGLWWSHDDFFNLHFVTVHRPWEYCFDPRVWRLLQLRMLTPLLFLSLAADLHWFGAEPLAFHGHQLLAAALAFLALYAALRLWLPPAPAALGTGCALAGAPTLSLVQLVMARHYLEGLLFAALAVITFVHGQRGPQRRRLWWSCASALAYLTACLAKEIYVPLGVLFPLVAEDRAGRAGRAARAGTRLRAAAPHLAALVLYAAWRWHMVGTLGGGYGWSVAASDLPGLAAALPLKLVREMAGPAPLAGSLLLAALAAAAAVAVVVAVRRRRAAVLLLAGVAAAAGPVLPASTEMQPRYAFALWLVLACAAAFGWHRLAGAGRAGRAGALVLAGVAAIAAVTVHRAAWAETGAALERETSEDRALLAMAPGEYLRHPSGPVASLHELRWFAGTWLRLAPRGGWFRDDLFLCSLPAGARVLEYDATSRLVRAAAAGAAGLRAAYCASIHAGAPLAVELRLVDGNLFWRLGPYAAGAWSLVVGGGEDAYPVPAMGGFQVPALQAVTLRVHYASPAGWNTYSPELTVDAARHPRVTFARGP